MDALARADHWVMYDGAQFSKGSVRNRQKIQTSSGPQWLSIPVITEGLDTSIERVMVDERTPWTKKHFTSIEQNYSKSPFWEQYGPDIEQLYNALEHQKFLTHINTTITLRLCDWMGIELAMSRDYDWELIDGKTERLVHICQQIGADTYLSGPGAKDYLDVAQFDKAGIAIEWLDYSHYRPYHQLHEPFAHDVSVLDLLLCEGPRFKDYMLYV